MIHLAIAGAALLMSFWFPLGAWIPIALVLGFSGLIALSVRGQAYEGDHRLSPGAEHLLQQYGHVYGAPFAAVQFAGASSTMTLACALVSVVDMLKGFWWGLVIAVPLAVLGLLLGRFFNPTTFYSELERLAHHEVIAYLQAGGSLRRTGQPHQRGATLIQQQDFREDPAANAAGGNTGDGEPTARRRPRSHLDGRPLCPACDGTGLFRGNGQLAACVSCGGAGRASRSMLAGWRTESDARGLDPVEDDARAENLIKANQTKP